MPASALGWLFVVGVVALAYRAGRRRGGDAPAPSEAPSVAAAMGDAIDGSLGVFGELTTALGAPLKASPYQYERSGTLNGPRDTNAR